MLLHLLQIVAGILFLQESFHFYHLIGGIIIIIGVVGTNFVGGRSKANEKV